MAPETLEALWEERDTLINLQSEILERLSDINEERQAFLDKADALSDERRGYERMLSENHRQVACLNRVIEIYDPRL